MSRSISHFCASVAPTLPSETHFAPSDLSRRIQSLGALLVVDRAARVVTACTGNAGAVIGLGGDDLLGRSVDALPHEIQSDVDRTVVSEDLMHKLVGERITAECGGFETIAHVQGGDHVFEFVPTRRMEATALKATLRDVLRSNAKIQRAATLEAAYQAATDAVSRLTGFDRVMVCAFASNQIGRVVAESLGGAEVPSFKGQSFPAPVDHTRPSRRADHCPYRAIHSVKDGTRPIQMSDPNSAPTYLSGSLLRPVAPAHAAYLIDRRIDAAFSVCLSTNDRPWGQIICHHRDPLWLSFEDWGLIQDIGTSLMARVEQDRTATLNQRHLNVRSIERAITSKARTLGQIDKTMAALAPRLHATIEADGFAMLHGTKTYTSGKTPPVELIQTLSLWAKSQPGTEGQVFTTRLSAHLADAKPHSDTATGVLVQPIKGHPSCQLIWFRGPDPTPTVWIDEPPSTPEMGLATSEGSKPWDPCDTQIADDIFTEAVDIVAGHLALLEENKDLKAITTQLIQQEEHHALQNFVASAVHDLKAPLRAIKFALEMMKEEQFDPLVVANAYQIAETSGDRMVALTDSILTLGNVQSAKLDAEPIEMLSLLEDVRAVLSADFSRANARLDLWALPMLYGDRDQIARLFENLVSNAIKYRSPDREPVVTIDGQIRDGRVIYVVSDNGIGIDEDATEDIFKPMVRLHAKDHIEGVGLGLTICQGIVDVHGGDIHSAPADPCGMQVIIELPIFPPS